jgi:hypothetical protein
MLSHQPIYAAIVRAHVLHARGHQTAILHALSANARCKLFRTQVLTKICACLVQLAVELVHWVQPHQQLLALLMGAILVIIMTILLSSVLLALQTVRFVETLTTAIVNSVRLVLVLICWLLICSVTHVVKAVQHVTSTQVTIQHLVPVACLDTFSVADSV